MYILRFSFLLCLKYYFHKVSSKNIVEYYMPIYFLLVISVFFKCTYYMVFFSISLILEFNFRSRSKGSNFLNEVSCTYIYIFFCYLKKPRNISDKNQHNYEQKIHPKKRNTIYFFALF